MSTLFCSSPQAAPAAADAANPSAASSSAASSARNTITITSGEQDNGGKPVPAVRPPAPAVVPGTSAPPASTVYRQVLPNGGTVYSDQPVKGAKVEKSLTVAPLIKGNGWTIESTNGTANMPSEPTPIRRRSNNDEPGAKRTRDDAQDDVMRAEMLLEDAKRRRSSGEEPLPGERTGTVSGKSRLNQSYQARQDMLERDVERAETNLQQAITERNNIR